MPSPYTTICFKGMQDSISGNAGPLLPLSTIRPKEVIVSVESGPKLVHVALPLRNRLFRNLFQWIFRIDLFEALGLLVMVISVMSSMLQLLHWCLSPMPPGCSFIKHFFKLSTSYERNYEHDSSYRELWRVKHHYGWAPRTYWLGLGCFEIEFFFHSLMQLIPNQ